MGRNILMLVFETLDALCPTKAHDIPLGSVLHSKLTELICHCCYEVSCCSKLGGLSGIACLLQVTQPMWIRKNELQILHACMFAIKDRPVEIAFKIDELCLNNLMNLLDCCHGIRSAKAGEISMKVDCIDSDSTVRLEMLINCLMVELATPNVDARNCVKSILNVIADCESPGVHALLNKLSLKFQDIILSKSLAALPPVKQVAILDALTFCLEASPPWIAIDSKVMQIINEAVSLTESEDPNVLPALALSPLGVSGWKLQRLAEASKSSQAASNAGGVSTTIINSSRRPLVSPDCAVMIRVWTIRLIKCVIFNELCVEETRNKYISIPFNSLFCKSDKVTAAAKDAITFIVKNSNMDVANDSRPITREVFQQCLKPIMVDLTEHEKLTLQMLESLACLLELLSGCFRENLGDKLLEHLQKWIDIEGITRYVYLNCTYLSIYLHIHTHILL
jgi:transformation/transcription domain-associated protein